MRPLHKLTEILLLEQTFLTELSILSVEDLTNNVKINMTTEMM